MIKFELHKKVKIIPLDNWPGVVVGIWIAQKGTQYQVRYFANSKAEEVYFFEDELVN